MPPKRKAAAAKKTESDAVVEETGRRKKAVVEKTDAEVEGEAAEDEVPKKKRGRQPKETNGVAKEKPEAKGKRGRKPKAEAAQEEKVEEEDKEEEGDAEPEKEAAEEEEPKKKRGRQAKETNGTQKESKGRRGRKPKPEAVEAEEEDDEDKEEEEATEKPKRGRGNKQPKYTEDDEDEPKAKKGRGKKQESGTRMNKTETDYTTLDFSCSTKSALGKEPNYKIATWNVNGIRAWIEKGGLEYIQKEDPDIICLQETKVSDDKIPTELEELTAYKKYWVSSQKKGYAGCALFTKVMPIEVHYGIGVEDQDSDGRCITAEFKKFYLVSVYVPNAGAGLVTLPKRLEWNEAFKKFVLDLDKKKPVIVCGDMNVAHNEIDLSNPKTNKKNAGFTPEERQGMTEFLECGFIDTYRKLYPDKEKAYTFWTYMANARKKNVGWRLDYFIVSERLMESVCDNIIRHEIFGSDHCPVTLFLNL